MLEAAIVAMSLAIGSQLPSAFIGPADPAPVSCQKVAVMSDRTGDVLYYNCK